MLEWQSIIYFIARWIIIIPLLSGVRSLKKLNNSFLAIFLWMACMFLIQNYSSWQFDNKVNNLASLHLMIFLDVGFCGFFFHSILKKAWFKLFVKISCAALLLLIAYNAFFIQTISENPNIIRSLGGYFMMLWSFIYLYELLKAEETINLFESPEFIAAIAILLYFGTTQVIHLLDIYVPRQLKEIRLLIRITGHSIMIVYYFLIGIALWKKK